MEKPKLKHVITFTLILFFLFGLKIHAQNERGSPFIQNCVVSAKFGPLMIFLKRWFAYNKIQEKQRSKEWS